MIVVCGPTASGKTELALCLARTHRGEIISCDSRQVYRDLSAGTDKPEGRWTRDPALRNQDAVYLVDGVPYHLVDLLDVTESFSAGEFARRARALALDISARGRLPILAGGTGLYLRALLGGLDPLPPADAALRARLRAEAADAGRAALHERLGRVDPAAAARIPPNNLQRVMRALEVHELTGKPISSFWTKATTLPLAPSREREGAGRRAFLVGIRWSAEALAQRIRQRCAQAFPAMIEEVRSLLARGVPADAPGLRTLGYGEALACLDGSLAPSEGLERYQRAVLQYAKRQRTWLRKEPLRWLDVPAASAWDPGTLAARAIAAWNLSSSSAPS